MGSEQFFDEMIDRGCLFGWLFTYMPVGRHAVPELMATAEQRNSCTAVSGNSEGQNRFSPLISGTMATTLRVYCGGRCYLHINARRGRGTVCIHPLCRLQHQGKSLLEALKSPLFMEYRKNSPSARTISVHALSSTIRDASRPWSMFRELLPPNFSAPEDVDVLTRSKCRAAIAWGTCSTET